MHSRDDPEDWVKGALVADKVDEVGGSICPKSVNNLDDRAAEERSFIYTQNGDDNTPALADRYMPRFNLHGFEVHTFNQRLGLGLIVAIALLLCIWLITLLLPWLLLLTGLGLAGYWWRRQRQFQQRLYSCFYDCLRQRQGKISALDFAIAAQITGPQARRFLDARAKDFFANFEPTTYGDVLYSFGIAAPSPVEQSFKLLK